MEGRQYGWASGPATGRRRAFRRLGGARALLCDVRAVRWPVLKRGADDVGAVDEEPFASWADRLRAGAGRQPRNLKESLYGADKSRSCTYSTLSTRTCARAACLSPRCSARSASRSTSCAGHGAARVAERERAARTQQGSRAHRESSRRSRARRPATAGRRAREPRGGPAAVQRARVEQRRDQRGGARLRGADARAARRRVRLGGGGGGVRVLVHLERRAGHVRARAEPPGRVVRLVATELVDRGLHLLGPPDAASVR